MASFPSSSSLQPIEEIQDEDKSPMKLEGKINERPEPEGHFEEEKVDSEEGEGMEGQEEAKDPEDLERPDDGAEDHPEFESLESKIEYLQQKLQSLSQNQLETIERLNSERWKRESLEQQLGEQAHSYQNQMYSQMLLLNEKAKEQEIYIQSIKVNMQEMTRSYDEKQEELDTKKRKLYKVNKERNDLYRQIKRLKEQLRDALQIASDKEALIQEHMSMVSQGESLNCGEIQSEIQLSHSSKEEEIKQLRDLVDQLEVFKTKCSEKADENELLAKENEALRKEAEEQRQKAAYLQKCLTSIREQNLNSFDTIQSQRNIEVPTKPSKKSRNETDHTEEDKLEALTPAMNLTFENKGPQYHTFKASEEPQMEERPALFSNENQDYFQTGKFVPTSRIDFQMNLFSGLSRSTGYRSGLQGQEVQSRKFKAPFQPTLGVARAAVAPIGVVPRPYKTMKQKREEKYSFD